MQTLLTIDGLAQDEARLIDTADDLMEGKARPSNQDVGHLERLMDDVARPIYTTGDLVESKA